RRRAPAASAGADAGGRSAPGRARARGRRARAAARARSLRPSPLGLILAAWSTGDKRLAVSRPSGPSRTLLAVLTTNQKGAVAETAVIHEAVKLGLGVWIPVSAHERYDLILDVGTRLLRVQCKFAQQLGAVIEIRCRRCRRGGTGLIHRRYEPGEIDCIAAYCDDTSTCFCSRIIFPSGV